MLAFFFWRSVVAAALEEAARIHDAALGFDRLRPVAGHFVENREVVALAQLQFLEVGFADSAAADDKAAQRLHALPGRVDVADFNRAVGFEDEVGLHAGFRVFGFRPIQFRRCKARVRQVGVDAAVLNLAAVARERRDDHRPAFDIGLQVEPEARALVVVQCRGDVEARTGFGGAGEILRPGEAHRRGVHLHGAMGLHALHAQSHRERAAGEFELIVDAQAHVFQFGRDVDPYILGFQIPQHRDREREIHIRLAAGFGRFDAVTRRIAKPRAIENGKDLGGRTRQCAFDRANAAVFVQFGDRDRAFAQRDRTDIASRHLGAERVAEDDGGAFHLRHVGQAVQIGDAHAVHREGHAHHLVGNAGVRDGARRDVDGDFAFADDAFVHVRRDPVARARGGACGPQTLQVRHREVFEPAVQDDAHRDRVILQRTGQRQFERAAARQDLVDRQVRGRGVERAAELRHLEREAAVEHIRGVDRDVLGRPIGGEACERAVRRKGKGAIAGNAAADRLALPRHFFDRVALRGRVEFDGQRRALEVDRFLLQRRKLQASFAGVQPQFATAKLTRHRQVAGGVALNRYVEAFERVQSFAAGREQAQAHGFERSLERDVLTAGDVTPGRRE